METVGNSMEDKMEENKMLNAENDSKVENQRKRKRVIFGFLAGAGTLGFLVLAWCLKSTREDNDSEIEPESEPGMTDCLVAYSPEIISLVEEHTEVRIVNIEEHIMNLPEDKSPSEEKLLQAQAEDIELGPHQTIRDSHERKINTKVA